MSPDPIPLTRLSGAVAADTQCVDLRAMLARRDRPLPKSLMVVLDNLCRQARTAGDVAADLATDIAAVADWTPGAPELIVPVSVTRVILPDSSGLPALMDLAAARDAVSRSGGDPARIEPAVPVTLVIDHSLIVDFAGRPDAEQLNARREYARNGERYAFFKWAEQAFENLRIVPPGAGIIHQVHLEKLAAVVASQPLGDGRSLAFPELVLGCDSHTTMINGIGVLGWGVGGIDGEMAALGHPHTLRIPEVVGVRLLGDLPAGTTPTDLVLTITRRLREHGVVGAFVEFFGDGLDRLAVADRATIANMAPEYGATVGFFPIDRQTIDYLAQSGRMPEQIALVEAYAKASGLYREPGAAEADYSAVVEIDLGSICASVAGPKRPQDLIPLTDVASAFRRGLAAPVAEGGYGLSDAERSATVEVELDGQPVTLRNGSILVAAITSCTNTSNPTVMIGAGLLARNARALGLSVPAWVKTSLAPGSRLVGDYLSDAGLLDPLEQLGFHIVGYGCTTCSGKSGPIHPDLEAGLRDANLVAAAVLSGNRNFEGRIHKTCRANFLASPPLVVAYALAGRVDIDFGSEPLGITPQGREIFLRDIWPDPQEIAALVGASQNPQRFRASYAGLYAGSDLWRGLESKTGPLFAWDETSTYIKRPPFFEMAATPLPDAIEGARVLVKCGDSLTTDHITPSGEILPDSVAGRYLLDAGVAPQDFNAVTQRRGNHEFMARITFDNPRLKNHLAGRAEGGLTRLSADGPVTAVYDAARQLREQGRPAIVIAGRDYGMGSSRDWAAKGPRLLGVVAVLARSYERIHRSNLIGMGIIPLRFAPEQSAETLGLDGFETYRFANLHEAVACGAPVCATAEKEDGTIVSFTAQVATAGTFERDLLQRGGLFSMLLGQQADPLHGNTQRSNR
ncbi:aconitate hydratase AcnA [Stappia indica]|uniref:Aconitate hydratase n=1 Tax=Stappia indica TaxID=538381 RepID=A0A857CA44_9HYPH|nr:aconitate hydratase AcnA [Stappia indica]QGZ35876.1 aconitate hydratase AcnA [Stappia indica]